MNELKSLWDEKKLQLHGSSEKYRNHRIIRMDENTVTYYVKNYREDGKWKEFTIPGSKRARIESPYIPAIRTRLRSL